MLGRKAIVVEVAADMLAEPAGGAERVSQALLGETVTVVGQSAGWAQVRTPDGYPGWVRAEALVPAPPNGYPPQGRGALVRPMLAHVRSGPVDSAPPVTLVALGALLWAEPGTHGWRRVRLPRGETGWTRSRDLAPPLALRSVPPDGRELVAAAYRFLGVPYLWGGRSPLGIDCSGLTQSAYGLCGVVIPRDAHLQAEWEGFSEVALGGLRAGDLLFFSGDEDPLQRGITHVGMALDGERMIHAPGGRGVCVEPFDAPPYASRLVAARGLR